MPAPQRTRTSGSGASSSQASSRKAQAAARARAKAKENQAKHSGGKYTKWTGDALEYKDGSSTLISVIPYLVQEKRHPDGISKGELWYKRPFKIHKDVGAGDDKKSVVCPRSFNPRADCAICDNVSELSKDYEANKDQISAEKAKNRDLLLVYDHDKKKVCLMNEPYGGGNMVGFGMLLDTRLANPRQEDWAAFWLDGDDGMALDITWKGAGLGGKKDWVKPVSIDFIPRSQAPVPKDVWKQAVELSTLLVEVSSKAIEAAYYELPDTEEEGSSPVEEEAADAQETAEETQENDTEDNSNEEPGEEDTDDGPIDFSQLSRASLLNFAKTNFDAKKYREASKIANEKKLIKFIEETWEAIVDDDIPSKAEGNSTAQDGSCPFGHKFREEFNEHDDCKDCEEKDYESCGKNYED